MEPEVNKQPNTSGANSNASDTESGVITTLSSSESNPPTQEVYPNTQPINTFMKEVPSLMDEFWAKYQVPILGFGLLLLVIVSCKIFFAVIGAINDLPLLEPFFEIIGIAYFSWFLIRYLLPKSGRQELGSTVKAWTEKVAGTQDPTLESLASGQDDG